jgi:hypothetical protein
MYFNSMSPPEAHGHVLVLHHYHWVAQPYDVHQHFKVQHQPTCKSAVAAAVKVCQRMVDDAHKHLQVQHQFTVHMCQVLVGDPFS